MRNKTPQDYRLYILDMLTVTAGSWLASGCKDEALEEKFEYLLTQIHPNREVAVNALQMHINESKPAPVERKVVRGIDITPTWPEKFLGDLPF